MCVRSVLVRVFVCAAALLGVAACGAAPPPTASAPAASAGERAAATVRPAVLRVAVEITGRLTDPSGTAVNGGQPITTPVQCTAFGVGADGYLATAGHCVDRTDPAGLQLALVEAWLEQTLLAGNPHPSDDAVERGAVGWTAQVMDTRLAVEVDARAPGVPASVVEVLPFPAGDVALLKVDKTGLPVLELGPDGDVRPGVPVLSLGYPGISDLDPSATVDPTITDGQISARRTMRGKPVYESTATLFRGMSGGPTITLDGQVVGIGSFSRQDGARGINFIAPSSTLDDLLRKRGIRTEPGPNDVIYRAALDDYFSGRYRSALDRFASLPRDAPQTAYTLPFTEEARRHVENGDSLDNPAGGGSGPLLILVGVGAAGVATAVTVIAIRSSRRRRAWGGAVLPGHFQPPPGPPMPYLPFGPPGPPGPWPIQQQLQPGPVPAPGPWQVATLPVARAAPPQCTACSATLDAVSAVCLRCGKPR